MEKNQSKLPDKALEGVCGGIIVKSLMPVREWDMACGNYECRVCKMHGILRAEHKAGCSVLSLEYPATDDPAMKDYYTGHNFCGSCSHCVADGDGKLRCTADAG